jgi:hypothetical protein
MKFTLALRTRIVAGESDADVAKSVDATDFDWSACGETYGVEPLKFGES